MSTAQNPSLSRPDLREQVLRSAPILLIDEHEPFLPIRVGVTVFETTAPSPSFPRTIEVDPDKVKLVIEYAIYYDYDIQHLYDLEHVWVYLGHDGEVVTAECSFHGQYMIGVLSDRSNLTADGRVQLYVQPGKHAMTPLAELFRLLPNAIAVNQELAGKDGLLEPDMFKGEFKFGPDDDKLADEHLQRFRFLPSFSYSPYTWEDGHLVSWDELREEIPVRLRALMKTLRS
ncbi:hypothetical protein WMW72_12470 [Paenibacillus filicis]|uniref:DUF3298 domain-containing protein n=1 Tax=Paenibacillus filicis TaxID=669464 RepID=A0ABU9DIL9_9BACL